MKHNFIMREKVNQALRKDALEYSMSINVRHPLDVLVNDVGIEKIASNIKVSLNGLKIAPYYGCQIVRPERGVDDKDNPQMMDSLFKALGGENVDFPMKVNCCGGMLMTTYPEVGLELNRKILECASENNAEIIVTTCPLCQINLEAYQGRINKNHHTNFNIPILFFTQVLGMALGGNPRELGIQRSLIPFHLKDVAAEGLK
jgi:heterodisulfide reductase subunit B